MFGWWCRLCRKLVRLWLPWGHVNSDVAAAAGDAIVKSCRRLCTVLGTEQADSRDSDGTCGWAVLPAECHSVHARTHRLSTWRFPWTTAYQGLYVFLSLCSFLLYVAWLAHEWYKLMHGSQVSRNSRESPGNRCQSSSSRSLNMICEKFWIHNYFMLTSSVTVASVTEIQLLRLAELAATVRKQATASAAENLWTNQ